MTENSQHITSYRTNGIILIILLFLTSITIAVTSINLSIFTVAVALVIASVKVIVVLSYFMHLKFDNPTFRWMVAGIFLLFAVVLIITFLDYNNR